MSWDIFAVHSLLALMLFFVAKWLGKHSVTSGYHVISLFERVDEAPAFNFVFRVATPLVYLALVSAGLYVLRLDAWVNGIYRVVPYYFLIRWIYVAVVGRARLLNWPLQLFTACVTVGLAYALDRAVLAERKTLLPDATNLTSELWMLVIIYVYTVLNNIPFTHAGAYRRRREYIARRFRTLARAFGAEVRSHTRTAAEEALVYAVMIYETFNRPFVYRAVEKWLLNPLHLARSTGPMQVQSSVVLDDTASVSLGAAKLVDAFRRALPLCEREVASWDSSESTKKKYVQGAAVRAAAREYNVRSDYADEVEAIFDSVVEEFYPMAKVG